MAKPGVLLSLPRKHTPNDTISGSNPHQPLLLDEVVQSSAVQQSLEAEIVLGLLVTRNQLCSLVVKLGCLAYALGIGREFGDASLVCIDEVLSGRSVGAVGYEQREIRQASLAAGKGKDLR